MENIEKSCDNPLYQGCGTHSQILLNICPTTGGEFNITVDSHATIEFLKKTIAQKLKVSKDRLILLYREQKLEEGLLHQYGICEGAKIILLPNVEAGLSPRPELGIIHALESLNENQINEFLSGKAPLNLSVRLGDHIMLIQLQLSTMSDIRSIDHNNNHHHHHNHQTLRTCTRKPPNLIQASRNLQQTLHRLSTDVFGCNKMRGRGSIYSGTFSGALNPALQDSTGFPRKKLSTIIHILNDLLGSATDFSKLCTKPLEESSSTLSSSQEEIDTYDNENEDLRTRGKLEQLRLVMDERRERRRRRKQKPYSLSQADADTLTA